MHVSRGSLCPIEFGGLSIFDYTAGLDGRSSLAWIEVPAGARHARAWSTRSDKDYLRRSAPVRLVLVRTPAFEPASEVFED